MYISPKHQTSVPLPPVDKWEIDFQIDVFLARVDGWHLEVADRCINGWQHQDRPCIDAMRLDGSPVTHIPDSGWAVLQIVLNYFETIAYFKLGAEAHNNKKKWGSYELFEYGVSDVFPRFKGHDPNVAKILYGDLRGGLYHVGVRTGRVILRHTADSEPIEYARANDRLYIDPHKFVPELRKHLSAYGARLRDRDETGLRSKFQAAYILRYMR